MVRSCHETGRRIREEKSDEDGFGGEEKERKTEAEVDGQCECGLEREGPVGGGDAEPFSVYIFGQKHGPHTEVAKDVVKKAKYKV